MFTKDELNILEDVLNEEILNYLNSGYSIDCEYIVNIRNMMQKLNIREIYNYDDDFRSDE